MQTTFHDEERRRRTVLRARPVAAEQRRTETDEDRERVICALIMALDPFRRRVRQCSWPFVRGRRTGMIDCNDFETRLDPVGYADAVLAQSAVTVEAAPVELLAAVGEEVSHR
jgi:hypothetical protein